MGVASLLLLILGAILGAFCLSSTKRMALLVVIAAFVTRPTLELSGFTIRLEMVVGGLALLRLIHDVLSRKSLRLSPAITISLALTLIWLAFASVTSLNIPPYPARSMTVVIWCFLNVITAVWIAKTPNCWFWIMRWGTAAALWCSILAIAFWLAATSEFFVFGVQVDPTYGGYAAYVFSLEANILAGLLSLWSLVAVLNPLRAVPNWVRVGLALSAPMAILTTHTRAALVAYIVGLIFCALLKSKARKLSLASICVGGLGAVVMLLVGGDAGFSKFMGIFDIDAGTGGLRNRVGTYALNEWWSSPNRLVGLGFNSFGQRHIDETRPSLLLPGYIGNLPIQVLYDTGIIGALIILLAVFATVVSAARAKRFENVLILFIPYLLFSVATMVLWLLETWIFVGLVWGLCSIYANGKSNSAGQLGRQHQMSPPAVLTRTIDGRAGRAW